MVDRSDIASWLDGPTARRTRDGYFPGKDIGLPRTGPGSIARFGRRLVAVFIDWVLSTLIAVFGFGVDFATPGPMASFGPLLVFGAANLVLISLFGATVGQWLVGIRIGALGRPTLALWQVLVRTVLLCLFIPAVIWDRDGRGLHDRIAGTVAVRR